MQNFRLILIGTIAAVLVVGMLIAFGAMATHDGAINRRVKLKACATIQDPALKTLCINNH